MHGKHQHHDKTGHQHHGAKAAHGQTVGKTTLVDQFGHEEVVNKDRRTVEAEFALQYLEDRLRGDEYDGQMDSPSYGKAVATIWSALTHSQNGKKLDAVEACNLFERGVADLAPAISI